MATDADETFAAAMRFVLRFEGGFVDHPADPGGATQHGISLRFARAKGRLLDIDRDGDVDAADIRLITPERAAEIYRRDFWRPIRGDDLPAAVAVVAFDAAINCGPAQSARWLQAACGAVQDSVVGPRTVAAARGLPPGGIVAEMLARRIAFSAGLPTFVTFGLGWARRIAHLAMLSAELLPTPEPAA